jgi:hypothetical protein
VTQNIISSRRDKSSWKKENKERFADNKKSAIDHPNCNLQCFACERGAFLIFSFFAPL